MEAKFSKNNCFLNTEENNYSRFYSFLENIDGKALKVNSNLTIKIKVQEYSTQYYPKLRINLSIFVKNLHNDSKKNYQKKDFKRKVLFL
jgi:hypothetical protein